MLENRLTVLKNIFPLCLLRSMSLLLIHLAIVPDFLVPFSFTSLNTFISWRGQRRLSLRSRRSSSHVHQPCSTSGKDIETDNDNEKSFFVRSKACSMNFGCQTFTNVLSGLPSNQSSQSTPPTQLSYCTLCTYHTIELGIVHGRAPIGPGRVYGRLDAN